MTLYCVILWKLFSYKKCAFEHLVYKLIVVYFCWNVVIFRISLFTIIIESSVVAVVVVNKITLDTIKTIKLSPSRPSLEPQLRIFVVSIYLTGIVVRLEAQSQIG
jgi:hypothetical protein